MAQCQNDLCAMRRMPPTDTDDWNRRPIDGISVDDDEELVAIIQRSIMILSEVAS